MILTAELAPFIEDIAPGYVSQVDLTCAAGETAQHLNLLVTEVGGPEFNS